MDGCLSTAARKGVKRANRSMDGGRGGDLEETSPRTQKGRAKGVSLYVRSTFTEYGISSRQHHTEEGPLVATAALRPDFIIDGME
jgi:hypothetical protein